MSPWKKEKEIKGVSARSVLELKAVLATGSLKGKAATPRRKESIGETLARHNKGVADRAQRDLEAEEEENSEESRKRAMERKSEAYSRIQRGEVSGIEEYDNYNGNGCDDDDDDEDNDRTLNVDGMREAGKRMEMEEANRKENAMFAEPETKTAPRESAAEMRKKRKEERMKAVAAQKAALRKKNSHLH